MEAMTKPVLFSSNRGREGKKMHLGDIKQAKVTGFRV